MNLVQALITMFSLAAGMGLYVAAHLGMMICILKGAAAPPAPRRSTRGRRTERKSVRNP